MAHSRWSIAFSVLLILRSILWTIDLLFQLLARNANTAFYAMDYGPWDHELLHKLQYPLNHLLIAHNAEMPFPFDLQRLYGRVLPQKIIDLRLFY